VHLGLGTRHREDDFPCGLCRVEGIHGPEVHHGLRNSPAASGGPGMGHLAGSAQPWRSPFLQHLGMLPPDLRRFPLATGAVGPRFRSTLPSDGRSPFHPCASLPSLWPAQERTCTSRSAPMPGALVKAPRTKSWGVRLGDVPGARPVLYYLIRTLLSRLRLIINILLLTLSNLMSYRRERGSGSQIYDTKRPHEALN
jgi:hypothetical protein